MENSIRYKFFIVFGTCFLIFWVHFRFFHGGYLGYDELEYSRLASLFSQGLFSHDSLYAFRYAGFLPLSALYSLFGADDFANWLINVFWLLLIVFITIRLVGQFEFWKAILVAPILIFSPLHLLYLEKPMPDIITELGVLLCFYSLYSQYFRQGNTHLLMNVMVFISGILLIFFSKETFLVFYPVFAFFMLRDIVRKENLQFWKYISMALFIFIATYFLLNFILLGKPLARIEAIFSNRYISECTYELQPFSVIARRVLYELWLNMIRMSMLLPGAFIIVEWRLAKKATDNRRRFWVISWMMLLLASNFMTISYTDYVPLCPDPRHFLYLLPLGAIIISNSLSHISEWKLTDVTVVMIFIFLQAFTSWFAGFEYHWLLYLPIMAGVLLMWKFNFKKAGILLFLLGLFSVFVQNILYNKKIDHKSQKKLILFTISSTQEPVYVVTDGANSNIGNFYACYKDQVKFISFDEYTQDIKNQRKTYLIMNGMTAYFSETNWDKVDANIIKVSENSIPIYENKAGKVFLME